MRLNIYENVNQYTNVLEQTTTVILEPFDVGQHAIQKSVLEGAGDMIVATGAGVPARFAPGTEGQVNTIVSGVPAWADPSGGGTGGATLYNKSGGDLALGAVAIYDPTNDNAFTTGSRDAHPAVAGVLAEAIANNASGLVSRQGQLTVLVQGNVTRGNWLQVSSTTGRAEDSLSTQRPAFGAIGIALTGYAGGAAGSVTADVDIHPYTTTSNLIQLSTVSSGLTSTISHTVDAGTDLLVVVVGTVIAGSGGFPSAITFNGTGMTILTSGESLNGGLSIRFGTTIAYLRNPTIGTYNIVATSTATTIKMVALNYAGSMATTTLRTPTTTVVAPGTSVTSTPASAVLDIVIDVVQCGSGAFVWTTYGAGQTSKYSNTTTYGMMVSVAPGTAGTTTMTWSGTSYFMRQTTCAIAGS